MSQQQSEQDFYSASETILLKIADDIERADTQAALDVEYSDGILNIVIEQTGQTYVINRHSASQKIWYSSPITGADYFAFDQQKQKWLDDKDVELFAKIAEELSQLIHIE